MYHTWKRREEKCIKFIVTKLEKIPLGRFRCRWKFDIKMDYKI